MAQPKKKPTALSTKQKSITELGTPTQIIDSRRTDELVIALCGAVGSGVSTVAREVEKIIKSRGYETTTIKISKLIELVSKDNYSNQSIFQRIKQLQDDGNSLRKKYNNDILSQLAIKEISGLRSENILPQSQGDVDEPGQYGSDSRQQRRHATIIDSLKNPYEVDLLKKVYGKMFYVFGTLCNDKQRKERLTKDMSDPEASELMDRDKREKEDHGQQLLKTLQYADFFIRNNRQNISSLEEPISRFVDLMLGQNNITPTIEEFGMYIAESAARRSGCISRQVGATILTPSGDIVSTGRNDVPKAGGGLYGEDDGSEDCRCFKYHDQSCFNEKNKNKLYKNIEGIIKKNIGTVELSEKISKIITEIHDNSEIKDLLEYSRAVHAEMDAITSAARIGHFSLKGTTLFTTTFPCHHCARHIVASGIKNVYYIEPYEKSLATTLHSDAIDLDSQQDCNDAKKVTFLHFEGVAPKQYLHLFSCNNRKKDGRLVPIELTSHYPTAASHLDTFIEYESIITALVDKLLSE